MLGKTHFFIGISTALAVLQPQSVPVLVTGISAAAVGSVISDIDSGTSQAHQEADKVMAVTVSVIGLMLFLEYKFHLGIYERLMKNSSIMRADGRNPVPDHLHLWEGSASSVVYAFAGGGFYADLLCEYRLSGRRIVFCGGIFIPSGAGPAEL